jgi:citrate synthase
MVGVRGLQDVVAADSSICYIDGARGILSYRGIDIHELAEKSTFEEVCYLLWEGRLPRKAELEATRAAVGRERAVPREFLGVLASLARTAVPMDALRTGVSALADSDPDGRDRLARSWQPTTGSGRASRSSPRIRTGPTPMTS